MKRWLVPLALVLALAAAPPRAVAEPVVGLTTANQLFTFDSATPGSISGLTPVTGLLTGTSLVGIDFRPIDQQLVGVGRVGNVGTVYGIDPNTGAATVIQTGVALSGTALGVDFNPVPNALRIVSDAEQNLRIVNGGAGDVNVDGSLNPGDPNVVAAAYANNVPGGDNGQTTLYVIDSGSDRLLTQGTVNFPGVPPGGGTPVSPNTGTLLDVGALGVNTGELVGFDISGLTGTAFASLTPVGAAGSSLYSINLATGQASLLGAIGGGSLQVQGIAVAVPEPASLTLLAGGTLAALGYGWRRRRAR